MTLTFQKEVGERMVAPIMNDQRCRLSVMCQFLSTVKRKFTIPGRAFVPQPKVDVAVMQFIPRVEPLIDQHFDLVEKFCRHIFHFKNKYCIRGIETLYPDDLKNEFAHEVLRLSRVNPKLTAPSLGMEEIRDMCIVYEKQCLRVPHLFYYDYRKHKSFEEVKSSFPVQPPLNDKPFHRKLMHFMARRLLRCCYYGFIVRRLNGSTPLEQLLAEVEQNRIRNFSVVAHVDHGKSTLADRLLEVTGTIPKDAMNAQVLDRLKVERERGITVKAQSASMFHRDAQSAQLFMLNLVDTPGHVDFAYEVCRSMTACDGVLLLVDASQGVQAQTVANFWLAFEMGLTIIPVLNKCDSKDARPDQAKEQLHNLFDIDPSECLHVSAKTGEGIKSVIDAVLSRVQPPKGDTNSAFSALIFDCWHDRYRGCYAVVVVRNGYATAGQEIVTLHNGKRYEIQEVGLLHPEPLPIDRLSAGQVGYILANMKNPSDARVGDTICWASQVVQPLATFKSVKPMVFAGMFPIDSAEYDSLRIAVEKLALTDPSVNLKADYSAALGNGWRAGFLGMLHMEVFGQRLEDEYGMSVILTAPSVPYKAIIKENDRIKQRYGGNSEVIIVDPSRFPEFTDVECYLEPMTTCTIVGPQQYYGQIVNLCISHRGQLSQSEMVDDKTLLFKFEIPLAEIVLDFYNDLKQITSGYATLDYELSGYRQVNLVKLCIMLNSTLVEELSCILPETKAQERGRLLCRRLSVEIPRQLFDVAIQATIGKRVIAKQVVRALRKDFTQKLKGNFGDRTRIMKLIGRQKEGKKRMKLIGQAEIPKEVFLKVFRR
uniref:Translation factor GUF1 homolog, mitochondrial n=1 Tax=Trichuris muris TaxID=70415 RepID=A0A5S6Q3D8_TRIMR